MKEYSKLKRQKEQWYFKNIYTSNRGYSLCLSVHACGSREGSNTHLSVYLYLMKGPYDKKLDWPFSGKVQVCLLNQLFDEQHVCKTWTYSGCDGEKYGSRVTDGTYGRGFGFLTFVSNECLSKSTSTCQHLKDDCLYFKVDYSATEE